MKKISSNTLMSREEKEGKNSFNPSTSEKNYPEKGYQSFNTTFTNTIDGDTVAEPFGYSEGKISPVDGELSEDITTVGPKEASVRIFKSLASSGDWSSIATYNLDLKSNKILKYSSDKNSNLHKDLRFSPIDKKFDLFYFDFSNIKNEDLPYCIANALSSSRPLSVGFISGIDNSNLKQIMDLGFSKSGSFSEDGIFFIKKNDLNKISNIRILNSDKKEKASFLCDIADTIEEKIAGLQPYRTLKYGSGLLFPYKKPQDVTYHMGSVSFPIDIIFIGSNGKIKKIAENIQPGTLGVFGSSDISMVLEVAGGASSTIGLSNGDFVVTSSLTDSEYSLFERNYINFSNTNNIYVKTASFSKKISFENFDIFNHDKENLSALSIIKMGSAQKIKNKDISIYNFDDFLLSDFKKFLKTSKEITSNISITKTGALSDFLAINSFTPFEIRRAFFEIEKDLNKNKKVVIATNIISNIDLLKNLFIKRACEEIVFDSKIHSLEFISIPNKSDKEILNGLLDKYSSNIEYKKVSIDKIAGAPISNDVKQLASESLDILLSTKEDLEKIIDAFKNNSEQYTKAKDKPDLVKKSEKDFNLSCKRISKKIVEMLLKVKNIIKIMNKIKDISTVDEKIESLSLSCKEFVTTAEGIFNLQSKIKQDDFVDLLTAETNRIEKSGEDVENNINNFSDYISKNILNKKILSR